MDVSEVRQGPRRAPRSAVVAPKWAVLVGAVLSTSGLAGCASGSVGDLAGGAPSTVTARAHAEVYPQSSSTVKPEPSRPPSPGQPAPQPPGMSSPPLTCASTEAFTLSLAVDGGGQPTPELAAAYFAVHGAPAWHNLPTGGWTVTSIERASATVTNARFTLHTVHASDGTWLVDSGEHCLH
jgi:hypothetical protein